MTNKNVFEIIERLMYPTSKGLVYTPSEVFTAIAHGYYYIQPGKDTERFFDEIFDILEKSRKNRKKMYHKFKGGIPYEEWLWGKMASEALDVARSVFNERTYACQRAMMDKHMNDAYDDKLLKTTLDLLDTEGLDEIFGSILLFKEYENFFISDNNLKLMMEDFEKCCKHIFGRESDEYYELLYDNPDFIYELDRETIIDTICKYIDVDPLLLAHMVKGYICTKEPGITAVYTRLAAEAMYGYDLDVFNPVITDASIITPETFSVKDAKKLGANKSAEFMIGNIITEE